MFNNISREAIKDTIDRREAVILVEALPEKYFNEVHLPSAIQINFNEVDVKAPKLLPDKSSKIIVYCSNISCPNSGKVAARLTQLGYKNVFKYAEGKQDWIEAGFPIEQQMGVHHVK